MNSQETYCWVFCSHKHSGKSQQKLLGKNCSTAKAKTTLTCPTHTCEACWGFRRLLIKDISSVLHFIISGITQMHIKQEQHKTLFFFFRVPFLKSKIVLKEREFRFIIFIICTFSEQTSASSLFFCRRCREREGSWAELWGCNWEVIFSWASPEAPWQTSS